MKKVLSMLVAFGVCAMPLSVHAECGIKSALEKIVKDRIVPSINENASDNSSCGLSNLSIDKILGELKEKIPNLEVIMQDSECADGSCEEEAPAENESGNDEDCSGGKCETEIALPGGEAFSDIIDKINDYIKNNYPESPEASEQETPHETETETPSETPSEAEAEKPSAMSEYAYEVVRLVNVERKKAGLSELTCTNTALNAAAQKRAEETVQSFSHTRPSGESCFTVLNEYGVSYRSAGENIAMGQRTPAEVVNAWMNSEGHRANILNSGFTQIGVGVYQSGGGYYWSQMFIS